jgi:hypothetical protein
MALQISTTMVRMNLPTRCSLRSKDGSADLVSDWCAAEAIRDWASSSAKM